VIWALRLCLDVRMAGCEDGCCASL
jgi:hypothetical protein